MKNQVSILHIASSFVPLIMVVVFAIMNDLQLVVLCFIISLLNAIMYSPEMWVPEKVQKDLIQTDVYIITK